MGEPVDSGELVRATRAAQLGEQSAASDRLKLAWVADEDEPPLSSVGEGDELAEGASSDHAGFVHDERGPLR